MKIKNKPIYPWLVLLSLLAVGIFAWIDRQIFSMLMEDIKQEFLLSDTQLGLLGGVAFGLFYVSVGLPIAWFADRYNRKNIISVSLALWSGMTALCGLATGFITLFLARIGVGVGEAGGNPPAQSLLLDYFSPNKRAFALGVYFLYIPFGFLIGFWMGGWALEVTDWRNVFFIVGIPGILFAVFFTLFVKEKARGSAENKDFSRPSFTFLETLKYFLSKKCLIHIPIAGSIQGIGAFAVSTWAPVFFNRIHELGDHEIGRGLALAYGIGGTIGTLSGGKIADYIYNKTGNEKWYLRIAIISLSISLPFAIPVFFTSNPNLSFLFLGLSLTFSHMFLGPVFTMIHGLAGIRKRTQAAAFYLFLANLIAFTIGPLSVGVISDMFQGSGQALRFSLVSILGISYLWAIYHFARANKFLRKELAEVID